MLKNGCSICATGQNYINMGIETEKLQKNEKLEYKQDITKIEDAKSGALYRCKVCSQLWYLRSDKKYYQSIKKEWLDFFNRWKSEENSLGEYFVKVLEDIGRTLPDHYGNDSDIIQYPCAVEAQNGVIFPKSIVFFSKDLPLHQYKIDNMHLGNEIKFIRKSMFALSKEVRDECSKAKEVCNGFAPTPVGNGEYNFTLNWQPQFLDHNGFKGEDVYPLASGKDEWPIINRSDDIQYFIVDSWV